MDRSVLERLAVKGVITIYGDVTPTMVEEVRDALLVARAHDVKELEVLIQSDGGDVLAGLDVYELLRSASFVKKTGVVQNFARSMGAVILQACDFRTALPSSRILVHYVNSGMLSIADLQKKSKKLKDVLTMGKLLQQDIDAIFLRRIKMSIPAWRKLCLEDRDIHIRHALELGLVDSIRD